MKKSLSFLAAVGVLAAVGCGGAAPPATRVASAQAAIRAADEVGAENTPRAALHLKYARDQFAEAQRLIREDDNIRANMVLRRAEADAELALALARESASQREARALLDEVQALRSQTSAAQ